VTGSAVGGAPPAVSRSSRRAARVALRAVAVRPWLWPAAAAEVLRLAAPGWWRRWPPLPLPDDGLWRFRMETAYGGAGDSTPDAEDVVTFVRWCGRMGRWRRG
jgi:hypothetical protein